MAKADGLWTRRLHQIRDVWYPPESPRPSVEHLAAAISAHSADSGVVDGELAPPYLHKSFGGKLGDPGLAKAMAVSRYFQVPPDYFTSWVGDEDAERILAALRPTADQARALRAELLNDIHTKAADADHTLARLGQFLGDSRAASTDLQALTGANPAGLAYYTEVSLRPRVQVLTDRADLLAEIQQILTGSTITGVPDLSAADLASSPLGTLRSFRELFRRAAQVGADDISAADPARGTGGSGPEESVSPAGSDRGG